MVPKHLPVGTRVVVTRAPESFPEKSRLGSVVEETPAGYLVVADVSPFPNHDELFPARRTFGWTYSELSLPVPDSANRQHVPLDVANRPEI